MLIHFVDVFSSSKDFRVRLFHFPLKFLTFLGSVKERFYEWWTVWWRRISDGEGAERTTLKMLRCGDKRFEFEWESVGHRHRSGQLFRWWWSSTLVRTWFRCWLSYREARIVALCGEFPYSASPETLLKHRWDNPLFVRLGQKMSVHMSNIQSQNQESFLSKFSVSNLPHRLNNWIRLSALNYTYNDDSPPLLMTQNILRLL